MTVRAEMKSHRIRALVPRAVRSWVASRLVAEFHEYYYRIGPWKHTSWLGVPIQQYPGDLIVIQQIIWETRPDLIVEAGTFRGGSALYFATILDAIGSGEVLSIDIDHSRVDPQVRDHPRITLLTADSTAEETRNEVRGRSKGRRVMVHLDADHRRSAVLAELRAYADLVSEGCYAIVADTNIYGHPVEVFYDNDPGGPFEAVAEFLEDRTDFEVDRSREYQLVTFDPNGFLRRTSGHHESDFAKHR